MSVAADIGADPARSQRELAGKAGRLLTRLGLALLMIVLPVASLYSRRVVSVIMPIGAVLILLGALITSGSRLLRDFRNAALSPAGIALCALAIWVALTLIWTPYRAIALTNFAKSFGIVMLAVVVISALPNRSRVSDINLMPIGAGFAAIAAVVLALVTPPANLNIPEIEATSLERASIGLVLLVWPALAALAMRERWAWGGALAVAVTAAAVAVWTPAALAGMAVGGLVFSVSATQPRPAARILGIVFAMLIIFAPLLPLIVAKLAPAIPTMQLTLGKSAQGWADFALSDTHHLLTGIGFDTFRRAIASGYLPTGGPSSLLGEIWFELGLLGALAAASVTFWGFRATGKVAVSGAPFLLAAVSCTLTIAIWGLVTTQRWWLTLVMTMVIAFGCILKGQTRKVRPSVIKISAPATNPDQQ